MFYELVVLDGRGKVWIYSKCNKAHLFPMPEASRRTGSISYQILDRVSDFLIDSEACEHMIWMS